MRILYFDKDKARGTEETLNWSKDKIVELEEAFRKDDKACFEEEL